ncbi:glycosyltransferase family 2 protein [Phenylobacterium deserti]|uniref:glycosyltransferase family 2 protein n=1 Tax=Phenylobacterium deserti TaxID=1914756 RepID=UPI0014025503|nr:glycosyltransferase family 2 protein [Phenylobacterium deserti]
MSQSDRTVSVIIAAKNAGRTIARAVSSALAQPEAAQVILIDDGSSDDTVARAQEAAAGSDRLLIRSMAVNVGPSAARNKALESATSSWVCPLDGDDYFEVGRLGKLLDQSDGCDFVADDISMIYADRPEEPMRRLIGEREPLPMTLSFARFAEGNISQPGMPRRELGFLKPIMRRSFIDAMGLRYDETVRLGEDYVFYATALANGAVFKVLEPCGYVAVERSDSLSATHTTRDLQALLKACTSLASAERLSEEDRRAARRHLAQVRAKTRLREVLDARREGGIVRGLKAIVERAADAPYIVSQILADKRAAAAKATA